MKRLRPAAAPAEIAGIGKHSLVWTRAGRNAVASIEDDFSAKLVIAAVLLLWLGSRLGPENLTKIDDPQSPWRQRSPAPTSFWFCST